MNRAQKIASATALAILIAMPAEGLRQVAYRDPPGVLTVCYGSTRNVDSKKVYSIQECKARLSNEMLEAVDQVDRCHPGLPESVLAAFGDAVYNLGPTIACNQTSSTAARLLRAGKLMDACKQLPRWSYAKVAGVSVKLPGLEKRRKAEMALCMSDLI